MLESFQCKSVITNSTDFGNVYLVVRFVTGLLVLCVNLPNRFQIII